MHLYVVLVWEFSLYLLLLGLLFFLLFCFDGQSFELILTAFCLTGIIDKLVTSCDNSYVSLSSTEIHLVHLKFIHMVWTCFYVVLYSSFHLNFSLIALHTPSNLLLYSPLSYTNHFPSKTSTSFCLHVLCSFSLKLYYLCEVILNMHFDLLAAVPYTCLMAFSHLDRYWSYEVTYD